MPPRKKPAKARKPVNGLKKPDRGESQAQESEYRDLLHRIESRKDAATIKKIAARIERENR